jgi:hypothetical protein
MKTTNPMANPRAVGRHHTATSTGTTYTPALDRTTPHRAIPCRAVGGAGLQDYCRWALVSLVPPDCAPPLPPALPPPFFFFFASSSSSRSFIAAATCKQTNEDRAGQHVEELSE